MDHRSKLCASVIAAALCLSLPGAGAATTCGAEGSVTDLSEQGLGRLELNGKLGAVLQRDEGIVTTFDLSNPDRPKPLGSYDDDAQQSLDGDLAFSDDGKWLFYARQTSNFSKDGLHVLDVSDPKQPRLAHYQPQGGSFRVAYYRAGDAEYLMSLDAIHGLVVNRFEPTTGQLVPVHVDALPALKVGGPASAGIFIDRKDPALGRPLMYVTTGATGLQVFDISIPEQPEELGAWSDVGLAEVEVYATKKARTVYAATEYWFDNQLRPEVYVLDARALDRMKVEKKLSLPHDAAKPAYVQGMELLGKSLYVAHSEKGVAVFGPSSDVFETGPYAMDVEAGRGRMFVTDAQKGTLSVLAPCTP